MKRMTRIPILTLKRKTIKINQRQSKAIKQIIISRTITAILEFITEVNINDGKMSGMNAYSECQAKAVYYNLINKSKSVYREKKREDCGIDNNGK